MNALWENIFGVTTCSGFTVAILALFVPVRRPTFWSTWPGLATMTAFVIGFWTVFMLLIEAA